MYKLVEGHRIHGQVTHRIKVSFGRLAKDNLINIYAYIAEDSVVGARKVKKELVRLAHSLNDFPEEFSNPPRVFLHLWKNSPPGFQCFGNEKTPSYTNSKNLF